MDKAPDAFRTISEVAQDLDVPQHVLRFWESRFTQIRPMKRAGGRRYYRADDVDLLRGIRQLLYGEGYTIRGVQRILKEQGVKFVQSVWQEGATLPARRPEDDEADEAPTSEQRAPMRGLLSSLRGGEEIERREPRLDSGASNAARGEATAAKPNSSGAGLGDDDTRRLEAVLHELGECRRLLDSVVSS
jgi:DNA-binding transcriptional MerR regulator